MRLCYRRFQGRTVMIGLVAVLAVFTFSCKPIYKITKTAGPELSARAVDAPVEVIRRGEAPKQSFRILGKLFVEKSYSALETRQRDNDIVELLQEAARELGADAITDVHIYSGRGAYTPGMRRWAGALAIKYTPADAAPPVDFVIVIPAVTGPSFGQHETVRELVQYELQQKGYHAMLSNDTLTMAGREQLPPSEGASVGEEFASRILLLDYQLPQTGETDHIVSAVMLARDSGRIEWQTTGKIELAKEAAPADENSLPVPTEAALKRGVKKLVSKLPQYES